MYTELIRRSRVYLELKKQFDYQNKNIQNEAERDNSEAQFVQKALRQSSRSLLLTKKQLQQMIKLLHTQNIVLRGCKDPSESQPLNEKIKREQKQKQQAAHIQQLKFKLQIYSKQVKNESKRIEQLKFKIEVCEEYLKQSNTHENARKNMLEHGHQSIIPASRETEVNAEDLKASLQLQQVQSKRKQKNEHPENHFKNEVPMIQLIKGFEHLNKHNDSLLGSFNDRDSPSPEKNIASPFGVKDQITLCQEHAQKDAYEDSSSLIETSSFLANYQQLNGVRKFAGSIKKMLNQSKISADPTQDKRTKTNEQEKKFLRVERQEFDSRKNSQISGESEQNQLKDQSSDSSIEDLQNVEGQDFEQGVSFGMKRQLLAIKKASTSIDDKEDEEQLEIDNKTYLKGEVQSKQSVLGQKKVTFLNVLSKFNSRDLKVRS